MENTTLEAISKKYQKELNNQVKAYCLQLAAGKKPIINFEGDFKDHLAFHSSVIFLANKKG